MSWLPLARWLTKYNRSLVRLIFPQKLQFVPAFHGCTAQRDCFFFFAHLDWKGGFPILNKLHHSELLCNLVVHSCGGFPGFALDILARGRARTPSLLERKDLPVGGCRVAAYWCTDDR